jgi:nicotinamide riboside kinase
MIGQKNILKWVGNNVNSFPHFIVIVGSRGSGKRTLCKTIAHKILCTYSECEIAVDAVRAVIDTSYGSHTKVMYCFADADNMRPQAKNAMLKITEEPPENAYFCLTICDDSSMLDTIKSRAYVIRMQEYSTEEINEYYYSNPKHHDNHLALENILELCSTPYEVDMLCEYDKDFLDYVELVVDNIAEVEPANAFKSSSKLALKKDEGYDLKLFFRAFTQVCLNRINVDNCIHYANGIIETTKVLNMVDKLGVNKQQLYDKWVFNIRKVWLNE